MMTLYVLRLKQNKWYVGSTCNLEERLQQHKSGHGAAWTQKYPMVALFSKQEISPEQIRTMETQKTLEIMWNHGLNSVRGAEFCDCDSFTEKDRKRMVQALGHTLQKDYAVVNKWFNKEIIRNKPSVTCFKCGTPGHYANTCSFPRNKKRINESEESSSSSEDEMYTKPPNKNKVICFKCGTPGHFASSCYVKKKKSKYYSDSDSDD
jgi:predicted GIY-YIG superfamily endonuclease